MSEMMSMIIDAIIMVLSAGTTIISYTWLFTSEPEEVSVMKFIVLLLTASIGLVFSIASVDAVFSYFTEPYSIRKKF